ncbi:MAG: HAD family hydrolase [Spirochaetes bacterium GWF1_49_6]|nr:MAG: HAD family hydrolase [Spirochaetes bacterium GWF1_49_6]
MAACYRAVLFDLDGTLLDTLDDLADSMNAALASMGYPGHARDEYRYFVGDGVRALAERVLPEAAREPGIIAKCLGAMEKEYDRRWDNKTRPYDGIPELLDHLTGMHIKIAILSNKPNGFTLAVVKKLLSRWDFDKVYGAGPPGIPVKPDPSGAIRIASELDIPPREFLYLGDTNTDMRTAISAGMFPVGAAWGFRTRAELEAAGAMAIADRPSDLLRILTAG